MHHPLIETWRRFSVSKPPFILEEDRPFLPAEIIRTYDSHESYIAGDIFCHKEDRTLHTGLLPIPYSGALENAKIFLLQLNPGLSPGDYFAEYHVAEFRDAQYRCLRQENANDDFPFIYLDPRFCWHPGFEYWQGKLHQIICKIRGNNNCSYQEASSILSKNVALLELLPYHSRNFDAGKHLKYLYSVKLIQSYVKEILIPKAEKDQITIVVMRKGNIWGLYESDNVVVYGGHENRAAHLSLNSRGGKAIAKRMGCLA